MLELHEASIGYGKHNVLEEAFLALEPGEVVGLVAPNGYGKTTLMHVLNGERTLLQSGSVLLDGKCPTTIELRAATFYAPGDASILYPEAPAAYHLAVVKDFWKSSHSVDEVMRKCELDEFGRKPVRSYSQGMKQQLIVAMALMSGARYILMDETLNALDPSKTDWAIGVIKYLRDSGSCVLVSSHILETIDRVCGTVVFLHDKRLWSETLDSRSADRFRELYG